MPSFDIVSETDLQEVDNAVNGASREILTRYDFKGSKSTLERSDDEIKILAEDEVKLQNIIDMIKTHITRRSLDAKCLDFQTKEAASGNMIRQVVKIKQGLNQDDAKKITKLVKDSKMKVQASIQGDKVRVNGKKRDDLQECMQAVKGLELDLPLQFNNFRD